MDKVGQAIAFNFISEQLNLGKSVSDSFIPVIESILADISTDYIEIREVQNKINEDLSLSIPLHTLRKLLKNISERGKIEAYYKSNDKDHFRILHQKFDEIHFNDINTNIRIINLSKKFSDFAKTQNYNFTEDQSIEILCKFVFKNRSVFHGFFQYSGDIERESNDTYDSLIYNFLLLIRQDDSENYETLKSIYTGTIAASIFEIDNAEIEHIIKKEIGFSHLILDSSFLFRLLDWQTEIENTVSIETYNLIKQFNIQLCVLDITIEEMRCTLNAFLSSIFQYGPDYYKVWGNYYEGLTGFHNAYVRNRMTPARIREYIISLDQYIEQKKIKIITCDKNIKNTDVTSELDELIQIKSEGQEQIIPNMSRHKIRAAEHDFKLIKYVKSMRRERIYDFNKCRVLLLTNDIRLVRWNRRKHKDFGSVMECISEQQLTSILWLHSPTISSDAALTNIILALRNKTETNDDVFYNMGKVIQDYKNANIDSPQKISRVGLLYFTETMDLDELRKINIENKEETTSWVESEIRKQVSQHEKLQGQVINYEIENKKKNQEIVELREGLEKTRTELKRIQIEQIRRDKIGELEKINNNIRNIKEQIDEVETIKEYIEQKMKQIKRNMYFFSGILLIVFAFGLWIFFLNLPNGLGLFGLVPSTLSILILAVGYIVFGLFERKYSVNDLFNSISKKIGYRLLKKQKKYRDLDASLDNLQKEEKEETEEARLLYVEIEEYEKDLLVLEPSNDFLRLGENTGTDLL